MRSAMPLAAARLAVIAQRLYSPRKGRLPHGIIYQGVNKAAVYDVLLSDPRIRRHDIHLHEYNRALVRNSRHFFLVDPEHPFEEMPAATAHMLCEGEVRADNGRLLV